MIPLFSESEYIAAEGKTLLPCKCEHCANPFLKSKTLIKYERKKQRGAIKFCSQYCMKKHKGNTKEYKCQHCNKIIMRNNNNCSPNNYCSRSCSATANNRKRLPRSNKSRQKTTNALIYYYHYNSDIAALTKINDQRRKYWRKQVFDLINKRIINCVCPICSNSTIRINRKGVRKTCSSTCEKIFRVQNRKSRGENTMLRSKAEICLYDLCKTYFKNVQHNQKIMNGWDADISFGNNLIFWNGPWHYRDLRIKGVSLKQIQKRDEIKLNKFLDAGYHVFIYEDRYFSPQQAFEDLVNNVVQQRNDLCSNVNETLALPIDDRTI